MTGGRCHGPNCPWPAKVGYFHSETCAAAWQAQFWQAGPSLDDRLAEQSTPDLLAELPQFNRAWLNDVVWAEQVVCLFEAFDGDPPEFAALPDAVDGDDTVREAKPAKLPASSGAPNQQVASKDPQVGFLAKWINRLRFWRGTIRMEDR